ncbi:MAG TPA: alpha/beta hydrolase [Deltaproteobacteria bacterium]|nr:alpha/beta hydrolase [Deltaproteobacteria bacterium]
MKRIMLTLAAALLLLAAGCTPSSQSSIYESLVAMDRSMSGLTESAVTVDGVTMSYLERPGTGEAVVLLHGFGAEKDNWTRFARHIPKDYRIIAFDLPGHGKSSKPEDATYTVEYFTQTFSAAVDALKLGRFHLAGNSMGGYVSILYTARNPGRVVDLCLMDTAGLFNAPRPSDLQIAMAGGESPLTPTTKAQFEELLDYAFHKKPFMPWPVKPVLARRAVERGPFVQRMFREFNAHLVDPVPLLPGLKLPVLVIWGENDRILHVSTTEILAKNLPNEETVILKDCGHMPMLERPKETAGHYSSFIGKHRG